jgi:predicted nucleotidyltransferase
MDTQDLEPLLKKLVAWARAEEEILALYLHGSHAHGGAGALSDVDVAVLARPELTRPQLWRLEDRCATRWPAVVDLRVLNLAPLPFCYEVTAHGRRLWAADAAAVADWESLAWRKYWDFRPLLERDWKQYVEAVEEQRGETEHQQYQTTLDKVRAVHRRVREAAVGYSPDAQD